VGGDSTAAYVAVPGTDAQGAWQAQLWRYPLDGSTPTQLAVPPIVDGSYLSYSLDPSLVVGADGVATLWSTTSSSAAAKPSPILLQWAPLH
jgi:hypothetical protein